MSVGRTLLIASTAVALVLVVYGLWNDDSAGERAQRIGTALSAVILMLVALANLWKARRGA